MVDRVFDRSTGGWHPLDEALDAWMSRKPLDRYSAIGCNICFDHRVSREREAVLLRYFAAETGLPEKRLEVAISRYLLKEVQRRRNPVFLHRSSNGVNRFPDLGRHFASRVSLPVAARALLPAPLKPDVGLARVLDLNGLTPVFLVARLRKLKPFSDFPRGGSRSLLRSRPPETEVLAWLDAKLLGANEPEQRDFVASALDAVELSRSRRQGAFQPTWATYWSHFEPLAAEGPERWGASLGLPNRRRCARWLIALKYTVRETGGLVRPTTLDAGFNEYHFPSPPEAALRAGGHPVDLRLIPPAATLIPEFVHQQIPHPIRHWEHAGFLLGRTEKPGLDGLVQSRGNHFALLQTVYGPSVATWMTRCT